MKLSKRRNLVFNCESAVQTLAMKMRRQDKLIPWTKRMPLVSQAASANTYYILRWGCEITLHVGRKLFRKALFMLAHKFNANKQPEQTRHARQRCK